MPTPDFTQSAKRRREILSELTGLAIGRTEGAITKRQATKQAHQLILSYLREVVDSSDLADAFAAAIGLTDMRAPMDE